MTLFAHWWPLLCLTAYVLLVAALLIGNHRWVTLNRADITRRPQYPPPPPAPRPRADDSSWLQVWPTADEAEQAVYDRVFDRIVAMDAQADQ